MALTEESEVIESLFNNPQCGIAILDDQFRYVRINDTLARMNGHAPEFHLGKTLSEVLGNAATEIERQVRGVFSTGRRVDNFHLVANLPTREGDGHWNESYLPMKDGSGAIKQVCVIVTEMGSLRSTYYRKPSPIGADAHLLRSLTQRQLQVVQLLASGKSNKEVAAVLNISVRTVETYRKNVMEKLNIHSLVDLVHFAIRHGILDIPSEL